MNDYNKSIWRLIEFVAVNTQSARDQDLWVTTSGSMAPRGEIVTSELDAKIYAANWLRKWHSEMSDVKLEFIDNIRVFCTRYDKICGFEITFNRPNHDWGYRLPIVVEAHEGRVLYTIVRLVKSLK